MRSKLYGEATEEFDLFKLESPIRAMQYSEIKARLMKLSIPRNPISTKCRIP